MITEFPIELDQESWLRQGTGKRIVLNCYNQVVKSSKVASLTSGILINRSWPSLKFSGSKAARKYEEAEVSEVSWSWKGISLLPTRIVTIFCPPNLL